LAWASLVPLLLCILLAAPLSKAELVEGETYSTGDIISSNTADWEGCYNVIGRDQYAGYSAPGGCPGTSGDWIIFSYTQQTIKQTVQISDALNTALQQAGINVDGYFYHWHWKNGDAGADNQNDGADPMSVNVQIKDKSGNTVYTRTWDYTVQQRDSFAIVTGTETFDEAFNADDLSTFEFSASGRDSGYWAGYYGGELEHFVVRLNYSVRPDDGPSLEEQTVLNAQCSADPTFSPECPGYNDAVMAQITQPISTTGVEDTSGGFANDAMDTTSTGNDGMASVEETTGSSLPGTPEASTNSAGETTANAESGSQEASGSSTGSGRSLNANELNALAAADAVASNAVSIASTQNAIGSASGVNSSGGLADNSGSGSSSGSSGGMSSDGSGLDASGMPANDTMFGGAFSGGTDSSGGSGYSAGQELELVASVDRDLIDKIVNSVVEKTLEDIKESNEEISEKSAEEIAEENAQEDELAQAAMDGSQDESAKSALMGYNPSFRAYNQVQLTDGELYEPKEIYEGQQNYDNPNGRFFNGASDELHRRMIRSQYEQ